MESFERYLRRKHITQTELNMIKEKQISGSNKRLDEIMIEKGFISDEKMTEILALNMGFPRVNLSKLYISPDVIKIVPKYLAEKHIVLPIRVEGNLLMLALNDPFNIFAIDDIKIVTGYDVQVVIATKKDTQGNRNLL